MRRLTTQNGHWLWQRDWMWYFMQDYCYSLCPYVCGLHNVLYFNELIGRLLIWYLVWGVWQSQMHVLRSRDLPDLFACKDEWIISLNSSSISDEFMFFLSRLSCDTFWVLLSFSLGFCLIQTLNYMHSNKTVMNYCHGWSKFGWKTM